MDQLRAFWSSFAGGCMLVLTAAASSLGAEAVTNLSLQDVLGGIQTRAQLLDSVQVAFRLEARSGDLGPTETLVKQPLSFVYEIELKRLGGKMRAERKSFGSDEQPTMWELFAWNGQKRTGYGKETDKADAPFRGTVDGRKGGPFEVGFWLTPLEQEVFDLRSPLHEIIAKSEWKGHGLERIGPYAAYRMESSRLWRPGGLTGGSAKLEVWVDPTRDFAPVQLILTIPLIDPPGQLVEKMSDVRLRRANGVWVITDAVCTVDNNFGRSPSTARMGICVFHATDYQVGIDLSAERFEVEFPQGTRVYDGIAQMGYIAGEGAWVKGSDGLTEFVPFAAMDESDISMLSEGQVLSGPAVVGAEPQVAETTAPSPSAPASLGSRPEAAVVQPRSVIPWAVLVIGGCAIAVVGCCWAYRLATRKSHEREQ